jgi:hypothetical protein
MSSIGSPIQASLAQVSQAQLQAAKARDRSRAVSEQSRHFADAAEQRVAGVDHADAVRKAGDEDQPQERESKHARDGERRGQQPDDGQDQPRPRVDVKA